jgi:hypothetical protein
MSKDKKYSDTLRVRIDPELLENVRERADSLNTDVSTYVRWCISTGLYLDDLNKFIRLKNKEEE